MKKVYIILIGFCFALDAKAQTILLNENFNASTSLPAGWSYDSAGVIPVHGWHIGGFPPFSPTGSGFYNKFAWVDCNTPCCFNTFDCSIVTPVIDASALTSLYLSYAEQFVGTSSTGYTSQHVEVSNDSGLTWVSLLNNALSYGFPSFRNVINISSIAAGYNNIRIRFRYVGYDSNHWAIDSVVVGDSIQCTSPPDSGLTRTNVNFACSSTQLNLWIDNLSRGIGQTYQWQSSANNVTFNPIVGGIFDTLTATQNGPTYYNCLITCSGLSTHSRTIYVNDTPNVIRAYSWGEVQLCTGDTTKKDTMKLLPPYGGNDIVYQWQSSPDGITYTNIPAATDTMYVVSPVLSYVPTTVFRCIETCATSGVTRTSVQFREIINPNPLCYCFPSTPDDCINNNDYISDVSITATPLNVTQTTCIDTLIFNNERENYIFYDPSIANNTATLSRGLTYTINTTRTGAGRTCMWIDYDHNGYFDPYEYTNIGALPPGTPASVNFTIPANAMLGATGMRVRAHNGAFANDSASACTYVGNSIVKDFIVTIDTATGIKNIEQSMMNVEVFPNPAKEELTVSSKQFGENVQIKVTDITGREILSQKKLTVNCKLKTVNLTSGIYFVKVATDRGSVVRKFIRQ